MRHFPVFKPNIWLYDFPEFVVLLDLFLSASMTVMTAAQAISRFIYVCAHAHRELYSSDVRKLS